MTYFRHCVIVSRVTDYSCLKRGCPIIMSTPTRMIISQLLCNWSVFSTLAQFNRKTDTPPVSKSCSSVAQHDNNESPRICPMSPNILHSPSQAWLLHCSQLLHYQSDFLPFWLIQLYYRKQFLSFVLHSYSLITRFKSWMSFHLTSDHQHSYSLIIQFKWWMSFHLTSDHQHCYSLITQFKSWMSFPLTSDHQHSYSLITQFKWWMSFHLTGDHQHCYSLITQFKSWMSRDIISHLDSVEGCDEQNCSTWYG